MFIDENETINIDVYYKKSGRTYLAYGKKDFDDLKLDPQNKKKYEHLKVTMRPLGWGLFNELQEGSITRGVNGERIWNYKLYKENRLKTLIVAWDAKKNNVKGEKEDVPVSFENILSLAPDIAEAILTAYDAVINEGNDVEEEANGVIEEKNKE